MKLCALRILNAVNGPGPTVSSEMVCLFGVPVASLEYGLSILEEFFDQFVKWGNNFVASGYGKRSSRAKVVLYVHHDQRTFLPHCKPSMCRLCRNKQLYAYSTLRISVCPLKCRATLKLPLNKAGTKMD